MERRRIAQVVRVAGVRGDREVRALGEPGERADQGVGELAVLVGVEEDLVDVPVGVVVGEDRLADVLVAARCAQVPGRGADRVDRVVRVLLAVVVGVDAVGGPGRGDELHPALGAGGGDVQVGSEGGLDLVDPGEHLPGDAVLGSAGLVDREEERRDLEGVDDEVGDADRGGPELRDGQARVGVGRRAVRVAEGGLLDLPPSRPWRCPWRPGPSCSACRRGRGLVALGSPRPTGLLEPSSALVGGAVGVVVVVSGAAAVSPAHGSRTVTSAIGCGDSLVLVGSAHCGSAASIRPSPSLSMPSVHCRHAWVSGTRRGGVVARRDGAAGAEHGQGQAQGHDHPADPGRRAGRRRPRISQRMKVSRRARSRLLQDVLEVGRRRRRRRSAPAGDCWAQPGAGVLLESRVSPKA